MTRKPNFFIVGAPKCGTTSLYKYLETHPQIFLSEPKELNFFSASDLKAQNIYYSEFKNHSAEAYQRIFENASSKHEIIGEASVSYLFYPDVPQRIYDFNPRAKIVAMLRDPVKRAWSHYLMDRRMGLVKKDFDVIFDEGEKKNPLHFQQYFLLGNYYTQINNYLSVFPRESLEVIFTHDLKTDREAVLTKLCKFLRIDEFKEIDDSEYNSFKEAKNPLIRSLYKSSRLRNSVRALLPTTLLQRVKKSVFESEPPKISDDMVNKLSEYYQKEVIQLEGLLNCNLHFWK